MRASILTQAWYLVFTLVVGAQHFLLQKGAASYRALLQLHQSCMLSANSPVHGIEYTSIVKYTGGVKILPVLRAACRTALLRVLITQGYCIAQWQARQCEGMRSDMSRH